MNRSKKTIAALGAGATVAALAYGIPAIANAAGTPSPAPSASAAPGARPGDMRGHMGREKELTGTTAAKVMAAVLAKLPGATVERMSVEDASEGTGAAYEAHVRKADGSRVEVLLDTSFAVKSVNADRMGTRGGAGFGGHMGREKELTGTTAAKVKAAVLAKLPGATVERMSVEDASEGTGAAYEAHVRKADGSRVEVLLDPSFAVKSVKTDTFGGRGGHRFGGPGAPGSPDATPGSPNATPGSAVVPTGPEAPQPA